jgi:hypothetical protein
MSDNKASGSGIRIGRARSERAEPPPKPILVEPSSSEPSSSESPPSEPKTPPRRSGIVLGASRGGVQAPPPYNGADPVKVGSFKTVFLKKEKEAIQKPRHDRMKGMFDRMDKAFFQDKDGTGSAALAGQDLKAGKEFKAYLAALAVFETVPDRFKARDEAGTLKQAATAYLKHYQRDLTDRQKSQAESQSKKKSCDLTLEWLRHYDIQAEFAGLGEPPWEDSRTETKAAELSMRLDFETLPEQDRKAEILEGSGVSAAFWINKNPTGGSKLSKTFLFKPASGEETVEGYPEGGSAPREALAGRTADILKGMIGLRIDVPETHLVQIDRSRLPVDALSAEKADRLTPALESGEPIYGSLQEFAPTKGEVGRQPNAVIREIPPEDCQKAAVMDIITLNLDRHKGNFLIGDGAEGKPKLVPIDHGLTFPSREAIDTRMWDENQRFGGEGAALMELRGAHEPFSDQMKAQLGQLDPDALVSAISAEAKVLDGASKISEESLDLVNRSSQFLKIAAQSLSPAACQIALAQHAKALFDPALEPDQFRALVEKIVAQGDKLSAAARDYFYVMSKSERLGMAKALKANGWNSDPVWIAKNLERALELYKSGIQNPKLDALRKVDESYLPGKEAQALIDNKQDAETLAKVRELFPEEAPKPNMLVGVLMNWLTLQKLGGKDEFLRALAIARRDRPEELSSRQLAAKSVLDGVYIIAAVKRAELKSDAGIVVDEDAAERRFLGVGHANLAKAATDILPPEQRPILEKSLAELKALLDGGKLAEAKQDYEVCMELADDLLQAELGREIDVIAAEIGPLLELPKNADYKARTTSPVDQIRILLKQRDYFGVKSDKAVGLPGLVRFKQGLA